MRQVRPSRRSGPLLWAAAFLLASCSSGSGVRGTSISTTSSDGQRLFATYLQPRTSEPTPVYLLLHQPGEDRDRHDFDLIWDALEDEGLGLLAPDLRGHGASEGDGSPEGWRLDPEGYPLDLHTWVEFLDFREAAGDPVDTNRLAVVGLGTSGSIAAASNAWGISTCTVAVSARSDEVLAHYQGIGVWHDSTDGGGGDDDDSAGQGDDDDSAGQGDDDDSASGTSPDLSALSFENIHWIHSASDTSSADDGAALLEATSSGGEQTVLDGDAHGIQLLLDSEEVKNHVVTWCLARL